MVPPIFRDHLRRRLEVEPRQGECHACVQMLDRVALEVTLGEDGQRGDVAGDAFNQVLARVRVRRRSARARGAAKSSATCLAQVHLSQLHERRHGGIEGGNLIMLHAKIPQGDQPVEIRKRAYSVVVHAARE